MGNGCKKRLFTVYWCSSCYSIVINQRINPILTGLCEHKAVINWNLLFQSTFQALTFYLFQEKNNYEFARYLFTFNLDILSQSLLLIYSEFKLIHECTYNINLETLMSIILLIFFVINEFYKFILYKYNLDHARYSNLLSFEDPLKISGHSERDFLLLTKLSFRWFLEQLYYLVIT